MSNKLVSGVYAAILTPRNADDSVNVEALHSEVRFLIAKGISRFAVNGATGEFPITTPKHLQLILAEIHTASDGQAEILCGIGAASTAAAIELAAIAQAAQVKALLLPMPFFFPYQQQDLEAFCRAVAAATPLPILLYNLPQFTSGIAVETVRTLIEEVPNIIGIKDSSGSLDILRDLTAHHPAACRIVGNDSALCPAMLEGVCDGVVSGVSCALPELILATFAHGADFARCRTLLEAFIEQLGPFPTPWGLKWIVEARGVLTATFNLPLTAQREEQAAKLVAWFRENEQQLTLDMAVSR